jgi:hypothetical protein
MDREEDCFSLNIQSAWPLPFFTLFVPFDFLGVRPLSQANRILSAPFCVVVRNVNQRHATDTPRAAHGVEPFRGERSKRNGREPKQSKSHH